MLARAGGLVLGACAAAALNLDGAKTIGTALKQAPNFNSTERMIFEHSGSPGVINYLWFAGQGAADAVFRVYVDGEPLDFNLYMATGVGWQDETAPWSTQLAGKNAHNNGFLTYRIPFGNSVKVSVYRKTPSSIYPPQPAVTPDPDNYFVGKEGESCTQTCSARGRKCDSSMQMGLDNGASLIKHLGLNCTADTRSWWANDQPNFVSDPKDPNGNYKKCLGFVDTPTTVPCDGKFWSVERVCHCKPSESTEAGEWFWVIVRGLAFTSPQPLQFDQFALPASARIRLVKNTNVTLAPLEYTSLYKASPGKAGALFMVTLESHSHDLNFLEACLRAYIDGAAKPLYLSSGTEDFFNSAFYYNVGMYHDTLSGLSHKAQDGPHKEWQLSMYRTFDRDPVFFNNGVNLTWRNYEDSCPTHWGDSVAEERVGHPMIAPMTYNSYSWGYEWDQSEQMPAAASVQLDGLETIGTAVRSGVLSTSEQTVFESGAGAGVLTYLMFAGAGSAATQMRVYVDGETTASLDFDIYLAAGIGWGDETAPWGTYVSGKNSPKHVYITHRIPFGKSVKVTVQSREAAFNGTSFDFIGRGLQGTGALVQFEEFKVPADARLKLYKRTNVTVAPQQFTTIYKSPENTAGAVWMSTIQASSPDENFLEACIRAYVDGAKDPMFLSSGTEDFFNSAYYYNAGLYHDRLSGLTHKAQNAALGRWQLAMYRTFDRDPLLFSTSMNLTWRNHEDGLCPVYPGAARSNRVGKPMVATMTYDSYVWAYEWPARTAEQKKAAPTPVVSGESQTIGTAIKNGHVDKKEQVVFEHSGAGVMTYIWLTGLPTSYVQMRIYIDGETTASMDFDYYMAAGIGFHDETAPWGNEIAGKNAKNHAYISYRIPFGKSIRISVQLRDDGKPGFLWFICRGVTGPSAAAQFSEFQVPSSARLRLYKNEDVALQPLQQKSLYQRSAGSGAVWMVTLAVAGKDRASMLSGCVRAYQNGSTTPMLIAPGADTLANSAENFASGQYYDVVGGMSHSGTASGMSDVSLFRYFNRDPLVYSQGLNITWRNSDDATCSSSKWSPVPSTAAEIHFDSYVWVYEW